MGNDLPSIRHQLAILCRRKKARTSVWSPERPTEWRPNSIINPEDGQPFTDAGCWELVADHLEAGTPLTEVELRYPPGKKAYEIIVDVGGQDVYVKLQLGAGKVIGRSFHYSTR